MTRPFRVLTLCTGNVCRSPALERLLAARLGPSVSVQSAGTRALVGEPVHGPMQALMLEQGADPEGFRARQLTEQHAREADLVLALTRSHRAAAVDVWPGAVRRTFTLREFARIAAHLTGSGGDGADPGARLAALVPVAAASRASHPPAGPEEDDVVDPYLRHDDVYRQSMDQILPAVEVLVRAVG